MARADFLGSPGGGTLVEELRLVLVIKPCQWPMMKEEERMVCAAPCSFPASQWSALRNGVWELCVPWRCDLRGNGPLEEKLEEDKCQDREPSEQEAWWEMVSSI